MFIGLFVGVEAWPADGWTVGLGRAQIASAGRTALLFGRPPARGVE